MTADKPVTHEYDGYKVPPQGEDTPENRRLREQHLEKCREQARDWRENKELGKASN